MMMMMMMTTLLDKAQGSEVMTMIGLDVFISNINALVMKLLKA
jgi:hypothetical protein